jgi:hypothetical protein
MNLDVLAAGGAQSSHRAAEQRWQGSQALLAAMMTFSLMIQPTQIDSMHIFLVI